jgi:AbiTii
MSSLVEELQREALDGSTDVSALLRKAYVVATKLGLAQFKTWCDQELNGYDGEIPLYRKAHGRLRAWNPMRNSWIPVVLDDTELLEEISTCWEGGPIASIQDLLSGPSRNGEFVVTLNPRVQNWLMQGNLPLESMLHIGRGALVAMVDAVRNIILEWSLKLESEGIMGNGMSFSKDEKKIAEKSAHELQSIVNHITIHTMTNSSIQQGSAGAGQKRTG